MIERWLAVVGMVFLFAVATGADLGSSSDPVAAALEAEPEPPEAEPEPPGAEEDPEPQEDRDQEDDVLDGRASAPSATYANAASLAGADTTELPCGVGDDLFRPPIPTHA